MHEKQTYTLYRRKGYGVQNLWTGDLGPMAHHMAWLLLTDRKKKIYRMELDSNADVRLEIRAVGEDRFTPLNKIYVLEHIYRRMVEALRRHGLDPARAESAAAHYRRVIDRKNAGSPFPL